MLNDISQGIKEVTLLGQNVNSYCDKSEEDHYGGLSNSEAQEGGSVGENTVLSRGFKTIYKLQSGGRRFSHLLDQVSQIDPDMRIRFTSPHPKDFPDEVLIRWIYLSVFLDRWGFFSTIDLFMNQNIYCDKSDKSYYDCNDWRFSLHMQILKKRKLFNRKK